MDFNDTAEEAEFRAGVRVWLKKNAVLKDDVTDEMRAKVEARDPIEYSKEWQAKKADAGYACMLWPEAYGGRGAQVIHQVIYDQEESNYFVPGGVFLGFLPTVPQVSDLVGALRAERTFDMIETIELLERPWSIDARSVRPSHRMVGHTGFITAARRCEPAPRPADPAAAEEDGAAEAEEPADAPD